MTVRELIHLLERVYDKDLPVYVYLSHEDGDIAEIIEVDDTLNVRVDLNISYGTEQTSK
jgi:hypothetical protein